jgi:hypothetical protein
MRVVVPYVSGPAFPYLGQVLEAIEAQGYHPPASRGN